MSPDLTDDQVRTDLCQRTAQCWTPRWRSLLPHRFKKADTPLEPLVLIHAAPVATRMHPISAKNLRQKADRAVFRSEDIERPVTELEFLEPGRQFGNCIAPNHRRRS